MTKILLVEDHEELREMMSRRLRRRGFLVVLAQDGQEALDQTAREQPDIVLLDMNLPVLDGWTVAQQLRARGDSRPVIALTAHAMTTDRTRALEAGCSDYHPKPVDFEKLLTQIDEALLRAEEDGAP